MAKLVQGNENKTEGKKEWITGDVEHFYQNNDLVTKDESEKRILIIFILLAVMLLASCTILTEKCLNISSLSVKHRILLSSNYLFIEFIYIAICRQ